MTRFAKVAITIPPEDLAAADRMAARLGRSRSWVVAEAVRRLAAEEERIVSLDASRAEQLRRDLTLTAEERLRESEATSEYGANDVARTPEASSARPEEPQRFATYDAFATWRRRRESLG